MTPANHSDRDNQLRKELQIFIKQTIRLVDAFLNRWFSLKTSSAYFRMAGLIGFLVVAGFVISLAPYPWIEWRRYLQQLFVYLFNRSDKFPLIATLFDLLKLGIRSYFNSYVLWFIPAFLLPIFFAYQAASFYLADIFDLSDVSIARKFIRQVSLTGGRNVIHITEGDIAPDDRDSPIARIGGPGKVIVSLDSVALFEKADGRPNIIGPTEKEPKRKATLEGFERFYGINLLIYARPMVRNQRFKAVASMAFLFQRQTSA
jgi:hypothetical protein